MDTSAPAMLYDLDIFSRTGDTECLFDRLNYCRTDGGKAALRQLCLAGNATHADAIARQQCIRYLCSHAVWEFRINNSDVYYVHQYLGANYAFTGDMPQVQRTLLALGQLFVRGDHYNFILSGVKLALELMTEVKKLLYAGSHSDMPLLLSNICTEAAGHLQATGVPDTTFDTFKNGEPSPVLLYATDALLRGSGREDFTALLGCYYQMEAWHSLATAHRTMQLQFPDITEGGAMAIAGLRHPLVAICEPNDVQPSPGKSMLLVTGPNMAGKSTFMKSVGLAFYMAHLGIGVCAQQASLPFVAHIVTSIGNTDNIGRGYSYFYNEVLAVKQIALALRQHTRVLVIADELFKGTNVKDAMECSSIVLNGFLKHPQHIYLIATHLYELAEQLQHHPACDFHYFDGTVHQGEIRFSYKLREGISDMRLGTYILKQEQIPQLLDGE